MNKRARFLPAVPASGFPKPRGILYNPGRGGPVESQGAIRDEGARLRSAWSFRRAATLFVVALTFLLPFALGAGPPYTTDDPETPRRHGWEINLPYVLARSGPASQAQAPLFDLNYGLFDHIQLDLEIPVFRVSLPGQPTASGLGDVMAGFKWRFLEETKARPQVAIYPQICFPTGSVAKGLGAGAPCYVLPVAAEKNWGKWTASANLGYFIQQAAGASDFFYYGAAVTHELAEGMEVGVEVFGHAFAIIGSEPENGFNFGAELRLSPTIALLGSAGHGFRRKGHFLAYIGIQLLTGPNRGKRS